MQRTGVDVDQRMAENAVGRVDVADTGAGDGRSGSANELEAALEQLQGETVELRASRARLLLAADADRRAIERSLHDGLQQVLVALAVDLRRAIALLEDDPIATRGLLDQLAATLREGIDEAARLAQRIYPPLLLDVRGLASALRSAAESADVAVTIQIAADAGYARELIVAVYWCCVEGLSAAPAGTHATVSVADADGGLKFEMRVAEPYPREALERLRDRVEALGGELAVADDEGGGSRVAATLRSAKG